MCQALQSAGLQSMFAVYLLQVAAGVVAPLPLIPPPEAGKNFFKTLSTFASILLALAWILIGLDRSGPVMVRNTAKLGSNQSATGILYAGVAFVIIGELIARYLFLMTGLPL